MALLIKSTKNFVKLSHNTRFISQALQKVNEKLDLELEGIKAAGTWKSERVITSKQDVSINVHGSQGQILNFCANNYLGLSVSIFINFSYSDAIFLHWSKNFDQLISNHFWQPCTGIHLNLIEFSEKLDSWSHNSQYFEYIVAYLLLIP